MTIKEKLQFYVDCLVEQSKLMQVIGTATAYAAKLESTQAPDEQIISANAYLSDLNNKSCSLSSDLMITFEDFYTTLKSMSAEELIELRREIETDLNPKKAVLFRLEKYGLTEELKDVQLYVAKTNIVTSHITNLIFNKQLCEPKSRLAQ